MVTKITNGIEIHIDLEFEGLSDYVNTGIYAFIYHIKIINRTAYPCQLIKQDFELYDPAYGYKKITDKSISDENPIIEPEKSHQYISACSLESEIGKLSGHFLIKNTFDNHVFSVAIPDFTLTSPALLN